MKTNLPFELRGRDGCCSRVTVGQIRPHLGFCPGHNVPLQGQQGSRGCIPDSPEVKDFGIVNKVEVGVFLKLCCFFDDSTDVGNLISDSSTFSKSSLNIWKFLVHVMLKPGLGNFVHYFTSV